MFDNADLTKVSIPHGRELCEHAVEINKILRRYIDIDLFLSILGKTLESFDWMILCLVICTFLSSVVFYEQRLFSISDGQGSLLPVEND